MLDLYNVNVAKADFRQELLGFFCKFPQRVTGMGFPQTRHTLIQRIATGGDNADWREFLADYWGPVCRFAFRSADMTAEDAEDIASQTFEAVLRNQLLARWVANRSAKLRTLLCAVVRNVVANRQRLAENRGRPPGEISWANLEASDDQVDAFYAAWAEEILQQAVEPLMTWYHQEGRGDYFRVLHGKLCEGMTLPEVAQALGLPLPQVENAYKHARKRLAEALEDLVRKHVRRYCPDEDVEAEFAAEWRHLGNYLKERGGLEESVRCAYESQQRDQSSQVSSVLNATLDHMSAYLDPAKPT